MNFHQIVSDTMQRVHEEKNDQPLIGEKQIFNYLKIVCNKMIRLDIVEKFLALELFFCKSSLYLLSNFVTLLTSQLN